MDQTAAPGAGAAARRGQPTKEVSLYAPRETIYQREIQGPWQRRRAAVLFLLAGFFLGLPWVQWAGRQAVWFDVSHRKFYLFGLTFWPQDFIFLTALLMIAAFSLFFFTTLAGRLWCGYACPQTVWTKFYMWIEWLTEGDRNRRMRLDRAPWSAEKMARKAAKHAGWLALAVVVGVTFVGYFLPIRELLPRVALLDLSGGEIVFLLLATFLLYFDHGWMREQICLYACPYGRFQGAMFDAATLNVCYDRTRGEPRGSRPRTADRVALGKGDCVDCGLCVQVCPTGIDIRNGSQYECIGCAACIDACDSVMQEFGYAGGLVRYASEDSLAGRATRILRPRVVGYGAVLATMVVAFLVALSLRVPLAVDVIRDRARLFRETAEGQVENVYTLKIMNKDQRPHAYRIVSEGEPGFALAGPASVQLASGEVRDVPVRLSADPASLRGNSMPVYFRVEAEDDPGIRVREKSRFLGPRRVAG